MNPELYTNRLYTIRALTNLHVGNGEANYSVIDKQVQRDPITGWPQINASSLKGALREFISDRFLIRTDTRGDKAKAIIKTIFGSSPTDTGKTKPGYVDFFDARVLSLPVRTDKTPYLLATSKAVLRDYVEFCRVMEVEAGISEDEIKELGTGYMANGINGSLKAEEEEYNLSKLDELQELLGEDGVILMKDEHFAALARELPFVARNYLDNGESKNLWYEEFVPRKSIFYTAMRAPGKLLLANHATENSGVKNREKEQQLEEHLEEFFAALHDTRLHIGANTTVGYGLCSLRQVFPASQPSVTGGTL